MTQTSAFHFESLVWDWPIAIYLFLIGISAGLVTLSVLLRRLLPAGGRCRQYVAAHHADCRAGRGDPRSVDPRLPPDKTVDLLEADVPLQFYLGDVDGGDAVSALHGGAGAVAGENL
ncbi:formate-dependent nitrite reductase membrane subunit [Escherichia coli]|nr:formate-dependent nitrite reductase membrane subunit [Escherichia coli]GDK89474.1 formate-dependent nitrite reductase membrane subunit [Escherichia coli]